MPNWRRRVVWGRGETAATFWFSKAFISVDLPTLGRPTTATNPDLKGVSLMPSLNHSLPLSAYPFGC